MREPRDEFYVGYLPVPRGHLKLIRIAVPALLWVMVLAAGALALFQRSPGEGVWDQGKPITREGILFERPYPHLLVGNTIVFLVEQGKRGSQERARGLDGKSIRATGWRLERDGRQILELAPEDSALETLAGRTTPPGAEKLLGPATFHGEIVDYKCYLGAMKPGDGKSHKACAILCMTGGIPAMLVTNEPGARRSIVLAGPDGGPLGRGWIEMAGEPVEISGELIERGPLRVLQVEDVHRR